MEERGLRSLRWLRDPTGIGYVSLRQVRVLHRGVESRHSVTPLRLGFVWCGKGLAVLGVATVWFG